MTSNKLVQPLPDVPDPLPELTEYVPARTSDLQTDDVESDDDIPALQPADPSDDDLLDFAVPAPLDNPFARVPCHRRRKVPSHVGYLQKGGDLQKGEPTQEMTDYVADNTYLAAAKATASAFISYDISCQYVPKWHRASHSASGYASKTCAKADTLPDASADAKLAPIRSKL
ncbi:hypothetical protein C8R43DRAFT_1119842 [Mycena crocata]|nr:hypothetical protein C8R43DRAFT_1119842 [Mycena crocata]